LLIPYFLFGLFFLSHHTGFNFTLVEMFLIMHTKTIFVRLYNHVSAFRQYRRAMREMRTKYEQCLEATVCRKTLLL